MNMLSTIVAKSDQLNSDDLIGGPKTIRITNVTVNPTADQPVSVFYEGDEGKPYKVCKSMRRVMVSVWGPDANAYAGRAMTLYRDEDVRYGGMAVGGIRISHMSHIEKPVTLALTVTRANRKPFTVKPLVVAPETPAAPKRTLGQYLAEKLAECRARDEVEELVSNDPVIIANQAKPAVQEAITQALARFPVEEAAPAEEPAPASEADEERAA